jgi:hypothetical protein
MDINVQHGSTVTIAADQRWAPWRVWAIRIWYGLLSMWALSMSLGAVWLVLGKAEPGEHFGSGMVTALKLLAVGGVLAICWTGGRSVVAFQALVVGQVTWLGSERLLAVPTPPLALTISAVTTAVLWLLPLIILRPQRGQLFRLRARPSAVLVALAVVAAIPLSLFAVRQIPLSINEEFVDAVQIGVVLAAQVLLAALRPQGSPWLPRFVALATAWIGALVVIWPSDLTSPGRAWGIAVICWALLFAVVNEQDQRNRHCRHRHRLSWHAAPGA